jgi:hypothetical protein
MRGLLAAGPRGRLRLRGRAVRVPGPAGHRGRPLTVDGAPVYTFTQEDAGEVTGDNLTDEFGGTSFTWHVVRVDGSAPQESPAGSPEPGPYSGY